MKAIITVMLGMIFFPYSVLAARQGAFHPDLLTIYIVAGTCCLILANFKSIMQRFRLMFRRVYNLIH